MNIDEFKREIKEVCDKYDVLIIGTCWSEGINGEITVIPLSEASERQKLESFNYDFF